MKLLPILTLLSLAAAPIPMARAQEAAAYRGGWRLVWSDEFAGPAGAVPNPVIWAYDPRKPAR